MEKIINQTHSKETFRYAISRALERASYYGLRSLIVIYMIQKMEKIEAYNIYVWFTASVVFSEILGAILGDLLIGNKKAIIIGGIIQAIGSFCLCIPSTTGLYTGLFLVVLGGGLYTPNIISNFGKLYLNKTKLLDAGFTWFYFSVNIGSFVGPVLIGYIAIEYGWNIGFVIVGIIMLLSIIPIILSKDKIIESTIENKTTLTLSKRIINISFAFLAVGLFWVIYELGNIRVFDLQVQLSEISTMGIPESMWSSMNLIFILPVSLIAIILWTSFYSTQFFKLMIGFIFGTISFGILFLIPEVPGKQHMVLFLVSLLFLNISEIHILPIIHSTLTKYTNPKYLAILISLAFIPTRLFYLITSLFNDDLNKNPTKALVIGIIAMAILSIGFIIYNRRNKNLLTKS